MDGRAVTSSGVVKISRLASRLRRSARSGPDPTALLINLLRKQARKLQATLDGCNPKLRPPTDLLRGVKCGATSIAKQLS